jgi:hypothetical protein
MINVFFYVAPITEDTYDESTYYQVLEGYGARGPVPFFIFLLLRARRVRMCVGSLVGDPSISNNEQRQTVSNNTNDTLDIGH